MARSSRPSIGYVLLFFWRFGRMLPLSVWFLAGLAGSGWYAYEVYVARPQMAYLGIPRAVDWRRPNIWTRIFRNPGFLVGYSDLRGNPLWVTYALTPAPENAPHFKRPPRFSVDWRSFNRIGHEDYSGSGFDRGHLAPNHAIGAVYGREAQLDTFLMTNVTPQKPNLNQKLWERLEEIELDQFAKQFGKVWIVTGPIFDPPLERLHPAWRVEVPDAFYKIVLAPVGNGRQKALAFIMPQTVQGNEPLDHYLVSVDAVEKRTGLDFFHELEDAAENKLEAEIDPEPWRLKELARLPGRYSRGSDREGGDGEKTAARSSKKR